MGEILSFRFPLDIRYGPGARSVLAEFADKRGVGRPLLVTDSGLLKTDAYRLAEAEIQRVWGENVAKFTNVQPNPSEQDVENAWKAYADGECDGIIGLGGGSALDVARATRLKVFAPGSALCDVQMDTLPERLTPFCAIPTTAGTGSEVGRSSVIVIEKLGQKAVIGATPLMADMAVLDPELTVGLPAHLTAWTGMDAMTHAIEAFVCPAFHPMCDAIALEAIRFVRTYLPQAVADGANIEARGRMQLAAAMGAVAFQKDLGAAHSLSHALSSEFGVQHGLGNAISLPAVVRFNGEMDKDQYERVAVALGLEPSDDPAGQTADFLEEFNRSIGITQRLRDLNVPKESIPSLAEKAMKDGCHASNPRKCTKADMQRLYEEIW